MNNFVLPHANALVEFWSMAFETFCLNGQPVRAGHSSIRSRRSAELQAARVLCRGRSDRS